jgi:hypothetical protein
MSKNNKRELSGHGALKSAVESAGFWNFSTAGTQTTLSSRKEEREEAQTVDPGSVQARLPAPNIAPVVNGDPQGNQLGPLEEGTEAYQQRLLQEKQEATRLRKQREREEEAREEAARKERLRQKLEALGPPTTEPQFQEQEVMEPTYHYDHISEVPSEMKKCVDVLYRV